MKKKGCLSEEIPLPRAKEELLCRLADCGAMVNVQ